ncbi:MAG: UDP-3-O-(3-hydroxymyristoyl)glucosamine N-acyltransferase [Porphyromonas sp.]|nr:UDP-3-O-(3-hydroxymyristoyl)glucosamine N-acyltransferase [Porphyromonas sp.]
MQFSARDIADILNGAVEGDSSVLLHSFGKIEEAAEGDLTFLANSKYEPFIYTTKASAVLVSLDFVPREPVGATLIRVSDPYEALAVLLKMVQGDVSKQQTPGVHSSAVVASSVLVPDDCSIGAFVCIEEGASIGKGCILYPYVYIGRDCKVADNTVLHPHVTLYAGTVVGKNCILHAGCVIGADGFGFAPTKEGYDKIPQLGHVEIEDDVEIGANTCIDRAVMGATVVGKGTKLDNLIQVAHNCRIGQHTVMAAQVGIAGSCTVGDWCQFGGQSGLPGHISVGDRVQLGGQSGVIGNVPSGSRLLGSPAMEFPTAMRAYAALAQLPELLRRVDQLEREIKNASKE